MEPNAVILRAHPVTALVNNSVRTDQLIARTTSIFGALALLLAAIGIYGVLAYAVSQRTTEIGIRMAIGAEANTVIAMVLKEMGLMLATGLAAGLLLSGFVSRLIQSQLVGLQPVDPVVFGCAVSLIVLLGLAAGYVPALRASRVDPVRALRNE